MRRPRAWSRGIARPSRAIGICLWAAALLQPGSLPAQEPVPRTGEPASPAPDDSLGLYLRGLSDSTDAYFGPEAAVFDTTGIDSLLLLRGTSKPDPRDSRSERVAYRLDPVLRFHRATGTVVGLHVPVTLSGTTTLDMEMSYGHANREGRYRAGLERRFPPGPEAHAPAVAVALSYERATVPFAAEHEARFPSTVAAVFAGRDQQSVYERRGFAASLAWNGRDRGVMIGWRAARDQSMPLRSRFSVWGDDASVPGVTPVREGSYREAFTRLEITRRGWPGIAAEGRYASRSRWRLRGAAAVKAALPGFEARLETEAGSAAAAAPPQDRFELGGPEAVPTLGFGDESGNRLFLGKLELVHGMDLVRALPVSALRFMALHPALFVQEGAAWSARDGDPARPPDGAWRGAAGIALVHIPGFPRESTQVRFQLAWPLGAHSGPARFSVTIGDWSDLLR